MWRLARLFARVQLMVCFSKSILQMYDNERLYARSFQKN